MKNALLALSLIITLAIAGFAARPAATVTSIALDPNPVAVGALETITVSVAPVPVKGGILMVEQAQLSGVPVSCEALAADPLADFEEVAMAKPAISGSLAYVADTSVAGSFGYRGHFAPAGSHLGQSKSACVDLVVQ